VFAEMLLDVINHGVTLNAAEAASEEFHNSGIGIHCGKRFPILLTPLTQANAAARQCHKGTHHCAARVGCDNALRFRRNSSRCTLEHRSPNPSATWGLDFKGQIRPSAICSVSKIMAINRSIFGIRAY